MLLHILILMNLTSVLDGKRTQTQPDTRTRSWLKACLSCLCTVAVSGLRLGLLTSWDAGRSEVGQPLVLIAHMWVQ